MKHYVYIIQSDRDARYYIGSTGDVELRVQRHNEGWTKSTKCRIPWKLVYVEEYENKSNALKREREIKRKKSREYIERLVKAGGRPVSK